MGAVKGLWQDQYDAVGEEYPGILSRKEAAARLRSLGINEDEVEDHLDAMEEADDEEEER